MNTQNEKMTNYRWVICSMLFFATTVNYMDRQVLSLTWKDFIAPEFHWTNADYGNITATFSIIYALAMLFAGKFVDWMDTKKGYLWSIGVWSFGACLHALCGIGTEWVVGLDSAEALRIAEGADLVAKIASISVTFFIIARFVLAVGEAGNFPAAIKATAEFFPKKDRAFATSIFNAGATVGALAAPVSIPFIAASFGWELAFLIIGALGFVWMGFWVFIYKKTEAHPRVNASELSYIRQDNDHEPAGTTEAPAKKMPFMQCFTYKQTWAFAFGKFMTDGVWWFFLFWTPAYLSSVYGLDSTQSAPQIFVLYLITLLSIVGGWLPTYFVEKKGMHPYAGRMRSMLIFAFFPLLALLAQPLGGMTEEFGALAVWFPVVIIGIAGAAHQAWSANIFSTVGDMFPRSAIATVTGIGGMAGGVGAFVINMSSGVLFDHATNTQMQFMGFKGIEAGYFIIFSICAVSYLIGWVVMKMLVPTYKKINL